MSRWHRCNHWFINTLTCSILLWLPVPASSAPGGTPSAAAPPGQDPVSLLEIPFTVPLDTAYQEAERLLPQQTGHWQGWENRHGINTRYRAWRGKLRFQLAGDTLLIQTHIRYWIKIRTTLLESLEITGSCGVNEPPRQAIIGLQMRLGWNPDWSLRPAFRVLPTRFIDRCLMTTADIDVTSILGEVFRQEMEQSLRESLQTLQPRMRAIQTRAQSIWQQLNEPLQLAQASWLELNPTSIALSPLTSADGKARVHLAIAVQPTLSIGNRPRAQPRHLPPLIPFLATPAGLRFQLNLHLDYAKLSQRLSDELGAQEFAVKDHRFGIKSVKLSDHQQQLHVELLLTGKAKGTADLWVDATYDAEQETFQLTSLDYALQPEDPNIFALTNLYYEKIRGILLETANKILKEEMGKARNRLASELDKVTQENAKLNLQTLRLRDTLIRFTPRGIQFHGTLTGSVTVEL